jgi:hypothetical protein
MDADSGVPIVSNRPNDDAFHQQRLKTWQPILTPFHVIVIFLIIGTAFLPTGIYLQNLSASVYEQKIIYDGVDNDATNTCGISANNEGKTCDLMFTLDDDIDDDLYVYYELTNFYQNHRLYVGSYSPLQLLGTQVDDVDHLAKDCFTKYRANDTRILNPCGLIANSFFNDNIIFDHTTSNANQMKEDEISWDSDNDKFKQVEGFEYKVLTSSSQSCTDVGLTDPCEYYLADDGTMYRYKYPDTDSYKYLYQTYYPHINPILGVTDPHFMVWMRTAARPEFRKLYGIIPGPFTKGQELKFGLECNFEVDSFKGTKSLVISTLTSMGGRNPYLGIAYIVVSVFAFVLTFMFVAKHMVSERRAMGDIKLLRWED